MADPAITTLDYGGIATRRGVVCDWRADGTLVITIPDLRVGEGSGPRWFDVPPPAPGERPAPIWKRSI